MRRRTRNQRLPGLVRSSGVSALLSALALLAAAPMLAQSIETGAIVGTVVDADGGTLPGVTVTVSSPALGTSHTTQTNENGLFRFAGLPASAYTAVATLEGFSTVQQDNIVLTVTRTLTLNVTMEVGNFEDTIVVEGAPLIDVQDSQLQTMELPNAILMEVPTERDIRDVVKLSPGVHSPDPDGRLLLGLRLLGPGNPVLGRRRGDQQPGGR